jgi:hypothetical protein
VDSAGFRAVTHGFLDPRLLSFRQIGIETKESASRVEILERMRKRLQNHSHGGESYQGSWAKSLRYFYGAEAKAAGMPVDQFLDLVGDRLDERGQRPKHFRRERGPHLWRQRKVHTESRQDFSGIDSIA